MKLLMSGQKRLAFITLLALLLLPAQALRAQAPDCYVLSAGVDNYLHESKLKGDDNDARNTASAFAKQKGKLFGTVYERVLFDSQATHAAILKQMQDFARLGKSGDYFVIFLSGHGGVYSDHHTWYFCPYDESPDNTTGDLPQGQILDCADVLVRQEKMVVIIIDACFSGRLIDAAQPNFKKYHDLKRGGLIIAVSSSGTQESQALGPYSAFAKSFADGMAGGADLKRTGVITLNEMRTYTHNRTYELLRQHKNNAKQDCAIAWSPNLSGEMPIAATHHIVLPKGESWAGKHIMPRLHLPKLWELTPKQQTIGDVDLAELTAQKDENGYLFVHLAGKQGWVKKEEFIPVDAAMAFFTQRIDKNRNDGFAYSQRAVLWTDKHDYAKAIADYSEAIRISPKSARLHENRGLTYHRMHEYDKAIADQDEAIRLDSKYVLAHRWRGLAYFALKQYDKALDDCNQAIALDPKHTVLYTDRGNVWMAKKEYAKAVNDYSETIRLDARDANGLRHRGQAYHSLKQYAKARDDFEHAVKVDPKNSQAWADLGSLLASCSDPAIRDGKQAVAAAEKACSLTNHKTPAYITILAAAYAEAGNFKEAIRWQSQTLDFAEYSKMYPSLARDRLKLYEAGKAYHEP